MKKENIFDLYAAQHKDEPAKDAERMPGEVKPEDVTPEPEPEKKQETPPDPPQDPEPEKQEGGKDNGA